MIEQLSSTIAILGRFREKLNEVIAVVNSLDNMRGASGVKVTRTKSDTLIQGSGGGLPDGFAEEEFTICEDGAPAQRVFLTKPAE